MNPLFRLYHRARTSMDSGQTGMPGEGAGFVVRNDRTGVVIHTEFLETHTLSSEQAVARMEAVGRRLRRQFNAADFVVEDGYYSSQAAFRHFLAAWRTTDPEGSD